MFLPPPSTLCAHSVNYRSRTAFTLIELVIVILILSVFFGIGYGSLTRARTHAAFKQAVDETVGILQDARNKALSNPEIVTDDGNVYVATAFYVTIDETINTLSLYADIGEGHEELLEGVTLDGDVLISLSPSGTIISYEPATGEITFSPSSPSGDVIITLRTADSAFTEKITIDQFKGMPEIVE